ncbi:MAG TPA: hypothetical protein PKK26_09105 [Candidatus Wallbacteria bacterium]|nr:hypothetical protein [Candidatus Wallbacteria bacterium]
MKKHIARHKKNKGYTHNEIILIFIITGLIVVLTTIYLKQSSNEAFVAGIKDRVKLDTKKVLEIISKDIAKSKRGSMEVTPLGKNGVKVGFQLLEGNTLMGLVYSYDRPRLFRKIKGKEVKLSDIINGLKINEDFNSGEMEIEVSAAFLPEGYQNPITYSEKTFSRAIEQVPEDVKILTEEGVELDASSGFSDTDEAQTVELDLFTQYANYTMMDLKKRESDLEFDIEAQKKREAEVNDELTNTSPGIKRSTYPLILPDIKDTYILELASVQPATDQKYVECIKKKAELITNQIKMKQELKIINSIMAQREKK